MRHFSFALVLTTACATPSTTAQELPREPAILMPAQIRGAALFPEELEMVRRATADFLRRQTEVPVSLVSDLTLAAVTQKHRSDPDAKGSIADAWGAAFPDALVATVTAACRADVCRVVVALGAHRFVATVINPDDVQTWVAAAGSLTTTSAAKADELTTVAATDLGADQGECRGAATVVVALDASGRLQRCHAHAHAGMEHDADVKCWCPPAVTSPGGARRYVVVTPAPTTSD